MLWALLPVATLSGGQVTRFMVGVPVVGIALALPLVFVLPGYTLAEAMFHRGGARLKCSYQLLLTLALSLAIDILSGFVLNVLPSGLNELSWALWLGSVTVVFAGVAFLRRQGVGDGRKGAKTRGWRLRAVLSHPLSRVLQVMVFAVALIVAIFAFEYAASSVAQQPYAGFTQLWMLPEVGAGNGCVVRMGVRSFEAGQVRYRVVMRMNGVRVRTWAVVVLAPQQEWEQVVTLRPMSAGRVLVEVKLYRLDMSKTVYRDVHVTWKVLTGGKMPECVRV